MTDELRAEAEAIYRQSEQGSLMPKVKPASYLADEYEGVEHIAADGLMALDGNRAGFRLKFVKTWAGNRAPVHVFLTEEDAAKLARAVLAGAATHGERWNKRPRGVTGA